MQRQRESRRHWAPEATRPPCFILRLLFCLPFFPQHLRLILEAQLCQFTLFPWCQSCLLDTTMCHIYNQTLLLRAPPWSDQKRKDSRTFRRLKSLESHVWCVKLLLLQPSQLSAKISCLPLWNNSVLRNNGVYKQETDRLASKPLKHFLQVLDHLKENKGGLIQSFLNNYLILTQPQLTNMLWQSFLCKEMRITLNTDVQLYQLTASRPPLQFLVSLFKYYYNSVHSPH